MPNRPTFPRPSKARAPLLATALAALSCAGPAQNAPPGESTGPMAQVPPAAGAPDPLATGRLPDLARPTGYHVALQVDPRESEFSGTVTIDIEVTRTTRALVLHGRGLRVTSARIAGAGLPASGVAAAATMRAAVGGIGEPEELVLSFDRDIPAGNAHLTLGYSAEFNHGLRGLYRVHVDDQWYAFTDSEPTDARRIVPCFDEPSFKVPWELTLTVPRGYVSAANMPEAAREEAPDGQHTIVRFAPTPPTSSYLFAFTVGPFDVTPTAAAGQPPVRVIAARGQGNLARVALDTASAEVAILGDYFGRPYPYPKLDLVAVPEFGPGAMENPGLITFRDDLLLLDPAHATTRSRRTLALVAAHELAHQWFGDLVTMAWWDDVWLNEAFATWMQSKVVDRWQPSFGARIEALRSRGGAMEIDALTSARAVHQPVTNTSQAMEAFDGITYEKGAAVLTMLEAWVGEESFRTGVQNYLREHEWRNASARDLFDALSRAAGRDVGAVAATFLDQTGVPLITVDLDCPAGGTPSLRLSQSRYRVPRAGGSGAEGGPGETRWQIPVCVSYPNGEPEPHPGEGSTARRTCTLLTEASATVPLEGATACPAWLRPDADEAGYYRYTMPSVVRALLTPERINALDVRAQLGLLDNAWALVRGGQMPADEFMTLLDAYRGVRARVVVDEIAGIMIALYDQAAGPESRAGLSHWMADYLRPIARELGWDARPDDDDERKLLRRTVLGLLGTRADDAETVAEAERRAQAYLRDPRSVDADIAAFALPIASRHAGQERLDALLAALPRAPTPGDRSILVSALGSFENPDVLHRALDATLTDALRVPEAGRVLGGAAGAPARRPTAIAWFQSNFDALHRRLEGDEMGWFVSSLRDACSPQEIQAESAFWRPRVAEFQGAERRLRESVERAEQCVALRERAAPRVAAFLPHALGVGREAPGQTGGARRGRGRAGGAQPGRGSAQHRKPIS